MSLKSVFIVRHSESEEDVDPTLHNLVSDNEIGLTENGRGQIYSIVSKISPYTRSRITLSFLSPSLRARETHRLVAVHVPELRGVCKVDPRLRNLNWGDITLENRHIVEEERYQIGVLKYQFPGGDDSAVYARRLGNFVEEVRLRADDEDYPEVVVIVNHGFAMRIIIKYFCNMPDSDFRWLANPPSAFVAELGEVGGGFKLLTEMPILKLI